LLDDKELIVDKVVLINKEPYSNSSAGLEKSAEGVPNTPPSPIFGALLDLLMAS
jgi:hypothetical protein